MSAAVDALATPAVAVTVLLAVRAAVAWQRSLTWPEYRLAHAAKRQVFPVLDRLEPAGFTSFVNDKGGRTDGEYLATLDRTVVGVVDALRAGGGDLHLVSSVKRRVADHGDPLSVAHVRWHHDDGTQTEAYMFRNADGTVDLYAHHETAVEDPDGHLTNGQTDGDPRGVVQAALDGDG
jgi:hypothetical protein